MSSENMSLLSAFAARTLADNVSQSERIMRKAINIPQKEYPTAIEATIACSS